MLAYPATAVLLLAASASGESSRLGARTEFMRAMTKHEHHQRKKAHRRKLSVKDFEADLYGDHARGKALRKKVFEKATFVKPGQESWRKQEKKRPAQRKLDEEENWDANYDWQQDAQDNYQAQQQYYNYNKQNNQGNNNNNNNNKGDGSDDYYNAYGQWENNFGFDVTQFALSYDRCASVKQYSDEIAALEDTTSVFETKQFAVFRFCPALTCMGWKEDYDMDCDEDYYGEDYCEYMEEYADYYENMSQYQQQNQADNQKYGWQNKYTANENGEYEGQQSAKEYNWQNEEGETWGARGEGCQSNYGEYLMDLGEYLELMGEWNEQRFEQYCEFCEECMWNVYQKWVQNGGDRKLTYEQFKDSEEHHQLRQLSDDHRELGGYYGQCPQYDTCKEYDNMCGGGGENPYADYMECAEVEGANGRQAWIGPHCAEDGFTVTLGVFSDEYCNEYIGNGVNIANFIGQDMDWEEDELKSYYNSAHGAMDELKFVNEENVCIPCREADNMWSEGSKKQNDDDQQDVEWENDEISEICENVYLASARCDKHYRSYNSRSKMMKFAQANAMEDLSCDFIDSIAMGNYNEMGNVNMKTDYTVEGQNPGWMGNSMYAAEYGHLLTEVTGLQIMGLCLSILAVIILFMWAGSLHRSLSKAGPWKPRRGFRSSAPAAEADLSRQNSGIVMGRSASNTSYYMS